MLESEVPHFFPKMHLKVTFLINPSRLCTFMHFEAFITEMDSFGAFEPGTSTLNTPEQQRFRLFKVMSGQLWNMESKNNLKVWSKRLQYIEQKVAEENESTLECK